MKPDVEQVYDTYRDNIFAIGFNFFKNNIDADDIVQETFVKYMKVDKEFESGEHARNWLIRVAVNECKKITLSSWFKRKESLEDYADKLSFTDPEESDLFAAVMNLP